MYQSISSYGNNTEGSSKKNYDIKICENFEEVKKCLLQSEIVCLEIYADWCQPCKQTAPDYASLAEKYNSHRCLVCKILYDNLGEENKGHITQIPIFRFYKNGEHLKEHDIIGANIKQVDKKLEVFTSRTLNDEVKGPSYVKSNIRNSKGLSDMSNDVSNEIAPKESYRLNKSRYSQYSNYYQS